MSSYFDLLPEFLRIENGRLHKIFQVLDDFFQEPNDSFNDNKTFKILSGLSGNLLTFFAQNYGIVRGSFSDTELRALLYAKLSGAFEGNDTQKILNVLEFFFPGRAKKIRLLTHPDFNTLFLGLTIPRAFDVWIENLTLTEREMVRRLLPALKPAGVLTTINIEDVTNIHEIIEKNHNFGNIIDTILSDTQQKNKSIVLENPLEIDFSAGAQVYSGTFSAALISSDNVNVASRVFFQNGFFFSVTRRRGSPLQIDARVLYTTDKTNYTLLTSPTLLAVTGANFETQFYFTPTRAFGYESNSSYQVRFHQYNGSAWTIVAAYNNMTLPRIFYDANVSGQANFIANYSAKSSDNVNAISLLQSTSPGALVAHRTYNSGVLWGIQTVVSGVTAATVDVCQNHFTIKSSAGLHISPFSSSSYTLRAAAAVANHPAHFAIGDRLFFLNVPATGNCTVYYSDDLGLTLSSVNTLVGNRVAFFGKILNVANGAILVTKSYSGISANLQGFNIFYSFDGGATWQTRSFTVRTANSSAFNNITFISAMQFENTVYLVSENFYCLAIYFNDNMTAVSAAVTSAHNYPAGLAGFQGFPANALDFRTSFNIVQVDTTNPTNESILENLYCYAATGSTTFSLRYPKIPRENKKTTHVIKNSIGEINANKIETPNGVSKLQEFTLPNHKNFFATYLPRQLPTSKSAVRPGQFISFSLMPTDQNAQIINVNYNHLSFEGFMAGGALIREYTAPAYSLRETLFIQQVNYDKNLLNNTENVYPQSSPANTLDIYTISFANIKNRFLGWRNDVSMWHYVTATSTFSNDMSWQRKDENGNPLPAADLSPIVSAIKIDEDKFAACNFIGNQLRIHVHSVLTGVRLALYTFTFSAMPAYTHRSLLFCRKTVNGYLFAFCYEKGCLFISDAGAKNLTLSTLPTGAPFCAYYEDTIFGEIHFYIPNATKIYILKLAVKHDL